MPGRVWMTSKSFRSWTKMGYPSCTTRASQLEGRGSLGWCTNTCGSWKASRSLHGAIPTKSERNSYARESVTTARFQGFDSSASVRECIADPDGNRSLRRKIGSSKKYHEIEPATVAMRI